MSSVLFDHVSCVYPGADAPSVNDLQLSIPDGEFLVLVGPSGCGKSTTLRMLAGLEQVTEGRICIDGRDVTDVDPKDRDIAMVFQNYALYPHMTVAENMGFALKLAKVNRVDREAKVRRAAEMLDLTEMLERKPKALSGGQRQRVAMGRAIVREPKVFLMDEPLSNLDARLRVQTRAEISALTRELGITTVYVTHDQTEAMTMGDRVAVLRDGTLQQLSTPVALYDTPANAFVAGFIGSPSMSLFEAPVRDGRPALVGIRPEDVRLVPTDQAQARLLVRSVEVLGAEAFLYGDLLRSSDSPLSWVAEARPATSTARPGVLGAAHAGSPHSAEQIRLVVRVDGRNHPAVDDIVPIGFDERRLHLFEPTSGERLTRSAAPVLQSA